MKKITIKFEILISDTNFDKSGFKDLVELIQSGKWDEDTIKQDKVTSSVSSVSITEVEDVIQID